MECQKQVFALLNFLQTCQKTIKTNKFMTQFFVQNQIPKITMLLLSIQIVLITIKKIRFITLIF